VAREEPRRRADGLLRAGRWREAVPLLEATLARAPDDPGALNDLGVALRNLGRHGEALACLERALLARPADAGLHGNRGVALLHLRRHADALAAFDAALALDPGAPMHWYNRGIALARIGRFEEAVAANDRALALDPRCREALLNRGNALRDLRRDDEARASLEAALALDPDDPDARFGMAVFELQRGRFERGWPLHESRPSNRPTPQAAAGMPMPPWLGAQPVAGKTILLLAEQGLGDTIQFCRYAPLLAARGAKPVLVAPAGLSALLRSLGESVTVAGPGANVAGVDCWTPLPSLPLACGTTLRTIPATVPYLHADPALRGAWRARLGPRRGLRVGLAWSGSPHHHNDANRSLPPELLGPLLATGAEFHALQPDAAAFPSHGALVVHGAALKEFSDTAGLAAELDLVVSVDTSVAHLAGALGLPVWILLPYAPDFRWLLDREDSPWYPTARLFRQARPGDWAGVVARVAEAMRRTRPRA